MNGETERFISELDGAIAHYLSRVRIFNIVHWTVTIAVILAGAMTTVAQTDAAEGTLIASPQNMILWGLIASFGAAINQMDSFAKLKTFSLEAKHANKAIRYRVIYGKMPLEEASNLKALSLTNPDQVLDILNDYGSKPSPSENDDRKSLGAA